MPRFFLKVMYDGTAFHGSQLQGQLPTVQLSINRALSILLKSNIITYGASRTDEGVHALCNYYHFDSDQELPPSFLYQMNAILPQAVAVKGVYTSSVETVNARFNAVSRRYRYLAHAVKNPFLNNRSLYHPYAIEKELLSGYATLIKDYTHFESFSKRKTSAKTFTCNIYESYWEWQDETFGYVVTGNRFLRGMVRGLVGTQLKLARAKAPSDELKKIIDSRDCIKADFGVPGFGLYLEDISYPAGMLTLLQDR